MPTSKPPAKPDPDLLSEAQAALAAADAAQAAAEIRTLRARLAQKLAATAQEREQAD